MHDLCTSNLPQISFYINFPDEMNAPSESPTTQGNVQLLLTNKRKSNNVVKYLHHSIPSRLVSEN